MGREGGVSPTLRLVGGFWIDWEAATVGRVPIALLTPGDAADVRRAIDEWIGELWPEVFRVGTGGVPEDGFPELVAELVGLSVLGDRLGRVGA